MKHIISFLLCWAIVGMFFAGVEAAFGENWLLIGFIPALFVGYCVYAGVDKIVDDYF